MKRLNVLVFPCGTELGLEIADSLGLSVHVNLFGASSREDHGCLIYQRYATVPSITDSEFNKKFAELIICWGIDIVFATHDSVHLHLAKNKDCFEAYLVNGDLNAAVVARSKGSTYKHFAANNWVPNTYLEISDVKLWPICIKPDIGQGGQGVMIVDNKYKAQTALESTRQPVICEYLPGRELTVDCFTDYLGELIFIGARSRERILGGISVNSKIVEIDPEINTIALEMNKSLRLRGPWFFQVKKDIECKWKLLELSCRLSSSSVVHRASGINLPLMAIHDYLMRSLKLVIESRISRVERRLKSRAVIDYEFNDIYIDFDETICFSGKAHPMVMNFLYQMLNDDKRIILVTRHNGDLYKALENAKINPSLFYKIIHLKNNELKSSVIKGAAIFIDNHFPERLDVSNNCGIPVFDVDALELLIS